MEPAASDTLDNNCLTAKEEENEYENETEDYDDEEEYGDGCCQLEGDVDSVLKGSEDPLATAQKARHAVTGRGVTLAMLMADGVIHPGQDAMSIDYLVCTFLILSSYFRLHESFPKQVVVLISML